MNKTLLKIGGSILTNKTGADISSIKRIAKEITNKNKLVLVHGAGYCGHPEADRLLGKSEICVDTKGIYDTHRAVSKLNSIFLDFLSDEIPVVPIHPLNVVIANDGRITAFDINCIKNALENDILPVIHGDIVFDRVRKFCIVSGDQIISYLARRLDVDKVGLATDVDGVYLDGKVLEEITEKNISKVLNQDYHLGKTHDVTGGMLGKIKELWGLSVESVIFNGSTVGNINRFLSGEPVGGTIIKPSRIEDL